MASGAGGFRFYRAWPFHRRGRCRGDSRRQVARALGARAVGARIDTQPPGGRCRRPCRSSRVPSSLSPRALCRRNGAPTRRAALTMSMPRMPRPLSPVSLVFVAMLVAGTANAETDANSVASQLAIASDSFCPSADAVREALLDLRPAEEWPSTTVAIHAQEQLLSVELGSLDSIQRQLAVGPDCAARATTVALVIATWMNDLPAEVAGTPILRSPIILAPEL